MQIGLSEAALCNCSLVIAESCSSTCFNPSWHTASPSSGISISDEDNGNQYVCHFSHVNASRSPMEYFNSKAVTLQDEQAVVTFEIFSVCVRGATKPYPLASVDTIISGVWIKYCKDRTFNLMSLGEDPI